MRRLEAASKGRGDGVAELAGAVLNAHSGNNRVVKAVLTAALYPNVAHIVFPEAQFKQMLAGSIQVPAQPHELKFVLKSGGAWW